MPLLWVGLTQRKDQKKSVEFCNSRVAIFEIPGILW